MKFKCLHGETMFSYDGRKFVATGGFFTTDEKGLCDFLKQNINYVIVDEPVNVKAPAAEDYKAKTKKAASK